MNNAKTALWEGKSNQQQATVNWSFTGQDALFKLKQLYTQLDLS